MDDITQIMIIPIMLSVALLWWSETNGRVPTETPLVVKLMIPDSIIVVMVWVHHDCYVQHRLEALDKHVDFFIIFRQMGVSWSMSILEAKAL
jgi:hypothetical protein